MAAACPPRRSTSHERTRHPRRRPRRNRHSRPVRAHILRHALATDLLRAGVDIVAAAEILGHARHDTTRRYILPTRADLEDAVSHLLTAQWMHR
ncbi:tyrosine-type recombinase/integrase [Streptosporangium sp. NPDC002721]|uniref:tyrosine-type recombinase/integrase n=1 Tax=Streptosporangium sp. NPDC002721 TaxID=3366188 RepID=UPI0036C2E892